MREYLSLLSDLESVLLVQVEHIGEFGDWSHIALLLF